MELSKKGNESRQLSLEQLSRGRIAALQNSEDLIKDAECLLVQGRWARSVFLSHIAIEELGKYLMIMGAIANLISEKIDWKRFWKRFFIHGEKAGNIFYFDVLLSPSKKDKGILKDFEKAKTDVKESQKEKLSSLYVDLQNDQFVQPMDIFNEKSAIKELENAKAVFLFFERVENNVFSKADFGKLSAGTKENIINEINKISTKLKKA